MEKENNTCRGQCLQYSFPDTFIRTRNCAYKCQLIQCQNFRVCKGKLPQRIIESLEGICYVCSEIFGRILEFSKIDEECDMCMKRKCITILPCCGHKACAECVSELYLTGIELNFEIEEEYDPRDSVDTKSDIIIEDDTSEDESIVVDEEDSIDNEDNYFGDYDQNPNLIAIGMVVCPFCRKCDTKNL
jgi:hypothetical protein